MLKWSKRALISIEKIVVFSLNILFRFRRWAGPDSVCPCSAEMERGFRRFLFGGPEAAVVPILRSPGFRDGSRLRVVVVRPVCIFRLRRRDPLFRPRNRTFRHAGVSGDPAGPRAAKTFGKVRHFWIFLVKYELFFLILRRAPVSEDVSGVGVRVVESLKKYRKLWEERLNIEKLPN